MELPQGMCLYVIAVGVGMMKMVSDSRSLISATEGRQEAREVVMTSERYRENATEFVQEVLSQ